MTPVIFMSARDQEFDRIFGTGKGVIILQSLFTKGSLTSLKCDETILSG